MHISMDVRFQWPWRVAHRCKIRHAFIVGAVFSSTSLVVRRCWLAVSGLGIIAVVVHSAHAVRQRAERRLRR